MFWELWGIAAGLVVGSGYIPQIIKGYKTKRLDDLSYYLNILMGFGMLMWIIYGLAISSLAVIATNMLGVFLNSVLLVMKYYYSRK